MRIFTIAIDEAITPVSIKTSGDLSPVEAISYIIKVAVAEAYQVGREESLLITSDQEKYQRESKKSIRTPVLQKSS